SLASPTLPPPPPPTLFPYTTLFRSATLAGANPLTQNIWDMQRSLDVLAQHPLVDPQRIGAVGLSYGGTATLFLAALDERVKAARSEEHTSELQSHLNLVCRLLLEKK